MVGRFRRGLSLLALALPAVGVDVGLPDPVQASAAPPVAAEAVAGEVRQLPLSFVENQGQVDDPVSYYVQGQDTSLYFTPDGVTFAVTGDGASGSAANQTRERWAVTLEFVGADPVVPVGDELAAGVVSYFGGPGGSHTGLATYSSIAYRDLWPGIDLVYSGTGSALEYDFIVHPGADPSQIRLAYRGATDVALDADGQIQVSTPVGGFTEQRPFSYQEIDGEQVEVPSAFALEHGAEAGTATFGIPVGAYDTSEVLVIDPVVLVYAGFIGGAGQDVGADIAVDSEGNAYVTGFTGSTEDTFPVTAGPDVTHNGDPGASNAFVAKVAADGSGLVYAGYIEGTTFGHGIAVDTAGAAYVTGYTSSPDLPAVGGLDPTYNGGGDAFVVKVDPSGTGLAYAGYLGGTGYDAGTGIAVDAAGDAFVSGSTTSTEATFPVIGGPDLTFNGSYDAFVAEVNPAGSGLVYAGYIGGAAFDSANDITLDTAGNAYVAGGTNSTEATFPVMVGPDLTYNESGRRPGSGGDDAFVAKVNAGGATLAYAGYIGGSSGDVAYGIDVDDTGAAYVVGITGSRQSSFPVTRPSPDRTYNGFLEDGFIVKVDPPGSQLVYAGYIGSDSAEVARDVAVDSAGAAYVTGQIGITTRFPTDGGFDSTHNGASDAFVVKVRPDGTGFEWGTFLGGPGSEGGAGIDLDGTGGVYIVGTTDGGLPTMTGPDLSDNGDTDAFVAKFQQT